MCLAVYIGSDRPVQVSKWDRKNPGLYIAMLTSDDAGVKAKFSFPNVYYVGSNTGCGCGFLKDVISGDEFQDAQANFSHLAKIISALQAQNAGVELYAC